MRGAGRGQRRSAPLRIASWIQTQEPELNFIADADADANTDADANAVASANVGDGVSTLTPNPNLRVVLTLILGEVAALTLIVQ